MIAASSYSFFLISLIINPFKLFIPYCLPFLLLSIISLTEHPTVSVLNVSVCLFNGGWFLFFKLFFVFLTELCKFVFHHLQSYYPLPGILCLCFVVLLCRRDCFTIVLKFMK